MEKMDFPAPKKYTEAELIELVQMKARIDAAAQPPAPVTPETTPKEVLPEQVMATPVESQLPSDASLLPELQL